MACLVRGLRPRRGAPRLKARTLAETGLLALNNKVEHVARKTIYAVLVALAVVRGDAIEAQIAFDDLFVWRGRLILEDRPEALNAAPGLQPDQENGWLVADGMEGQVRGYDASGRLIFHFGRKGRGPGEFRDLVGAVRTEEGRIVTIDSYGRIGIWSEAGALEREFSVQIRGVSAATLVPPNTLALASTPQIQADALSMPLLHFVNLEEARISATAIAPAISSSQVAAWVTIRGATITNAGDRHLFTTPLIDSIWEFGGAEDRPAAVTAIRHSLLDERARVPDGHADRDGFMEWLRNSYFVIGAVPAGPGYYLVRLMRAQEDSRLLLVDAATGEAEEITGSPPLLAYDHRTGAYFFRDRTSEPNRFRIAELRHAR
jgi:hypothetical protein